MNLVPRLTQDFGLSFPDESMESKFQAFYSASFAPFARKSILLAALLLLGDFLADAALIGTTNNFGNWLRMLLVMPLLGLGFLFSSLGWFVRRWQLYMSGMVVVVSIALFLALIRIDEAGGPGFSSYVGILNFTFVSIFCFVILGIQFRYALATGSIVLASYLLLMAMDAGVAGFLYKGYHVITLFVLVAAVGWMREKYIRRDFRSNLLAQQEREKSDQVLTKILPASIAERIKNGEYLIAEAHGEATVLFADLCGFTRLASVLGPRHLVELLNAIFSSFDAICEELKLEKIKTIGDAYMAVSGVPEYRQDHAVVAVSAGRRMLEAVKNLSRERQIPIAIRIGVHTGPVIGGVIGTAKYHYDLWGDAVNIASRMESSGIENRIHVSQSTYWLTRNTFHFECRGEIEIKGKGAMTTYLVEQEGDRRAVESEK